MAPKKLDFKIIETSKNGTVTVSINGKRYQYEIGLHRLPEALNLAERTPNKAVDFLKRAQKDEQKIVDKVLELWKD